MILDMDIRGKFYSIEVCIDDATGLSGNKSSINDIEDHR
jgi:hypothetical protein